jgi:hypothetical protein
MYHATPLAFIALVYALAMRQKEPLSYLFHVLLATLGVYTLVAAQGVLIGHYQYLLPFVPPVAALAGLGSVTWIGRMQKTALFVSSPPMRRTLLLGFLAIFVANALGVWAIFQSQGLRTVTTYWEGDKKTGLALRTITDPGSLIVVLDDQMDDVTRERSMTPPNVFYFSDRRGWYLSLAWVTPELIESVRQQGGRYVVVTGNALNTFAGSYASLEGYLSGRYREILDNADGRVYDLRPGRRAEVMP